MHHCFEISILYFTHAIVCHMHTYFLLNNQYFTTGSQNPKSIEIYSSRSPPGTHHIMQKHHFLSLKTPYFRWHLHIRLVRNSASRIYLRLSVLRYHPIFCACQKSSNLSQFEISKDRSGTHQRHCNTVFIRYMSVRTPSELVLDADYCKRELLDYYKSELLSVVRFTVSPYLLCVHSVRSRLGTHHRHHTSSCRSKRHLRSLDADAIEKTKYCLSFATYHYLLCVSQQAHI